LAVILEYFVVPGRAAVIIFECLSSSVLRFITKLLYPEVTYCHSRSTSTPSKLLLRTYSTILDTIVGIF